MERTISRTELDKTISKSTYGLAIRERKFLSESRRRIAKLSSNSRKTVFKGAKTKIKYRDAKSIKFLTLVNHSFDPKKAFLYENFRFWGWLLILRIANRNHAT